MLKLFLSAYLWLAPIGKTLSYYGQWEKCAKKNKE
jgi:hypothetical protein